MKFTAAYYLLLIYISVIIRPLVPVMTDAAEHFFQGAHHIATVHAKYGEHHVQITIANDEKQSKQTPGTLSQDETVQLHIPVNEYYFSFSVLDEMINYPRHFNAGVNSGYLSLHAPPPKC